MPIASAIITNLIIYMHTGMYMYALLDRSVNLYFDIMHT